MWENRYRQFKDQSWNCTCGKRGWNQKVELHMWQNVSPFSQGLAINRLNEQVIKKEDDHT